VGFAAGLLLTGAGLLATGALLLTFFVAGAAAGLFVAGVGLAAGLLFPGVGLAGAGALLLTFFVAGVAAGLFVAGVDFAAGLLLAGAAAGALLLTFFVVGVAGFVDTGVSFLFFGSTVGLTAVLESFFSIFRFSLPYIFFKTTPALVFTLAFYYFFAATLVGDLAGAA